MIQDRTLQNTIWRGLKRRIVAEIPATSPSMSAEELKTLQNKIKFSFKRRLSYAWPTNLPN